MKAEDVAAACVAAGEPIEIQAAPNAWDSPTHCARVAQRVAEQFPSRAVTIFDRSGRAVAGFVPFSR